MSHAGDLAAQAALGVSGSARRPLRPSRSALEHVAASLPSGETTPMPVTTTRTHQKPSVDWNRPTRRPSAS
jgi:hypothetical protein